ncbi:hypothetical protein [Altererythrobacter sp.]|uniref:hypothetical protein n=1 Tax=Altererythrobacter sp. TaxID=1872480 RepID=UPI003CFD5554
MRKIALILAPVALAACSSEPAEQAPADDAAAEPAMEAPTVANGSGPGTYLATAADGTVTTTVIGADGTYSDTDAEGNVIAEGSWAVTDGKTCFTPTTEGVEPMCFTETAPAEDGSFTATPDSGDPVTVKPAPAE